MSKAPLPTGRSRDTSAIICRPARLGRSRERIVTIASVPTDTLTVRSNHKADVVDVTDRVQQMVPDWAALHVDPSSLFRSGCRSGAADLLLFAVSAGGGAADRDLHRLRLGRLCLRHCQGQHAGDELRPGLLADGILGKGNLPAELAIKVSPK